MKKVLLIVGILTAIVVNPLKSKPFGGRKLFASVKRMFGTKPKTPVVPKAMITSHDTAYTLFNGKITRHYRFWNLHQGFLDHSRYKYVSTGIEKGTPEYKEIMGDFLYTNKGKEMVWDNGYILPFE